jgi:hypothetical protein
MAISFPTPSGANIGREELDSIERYKPAKGYFSRRGKKKVEEEDNDEKHCV